MLLNVGMRVKKTKGISKSFSKNMNIEEDKNCLNEEEYETECDNCILRSLNQEMYFQKIKNSSLSIFDDKQCYINKT